jgi:hypothetical protein
MKCSAFVVALIVAVLFDHVAHADADPSFECFPNPAAVHEAHQGSHAVYTTHATGWTESSKCWHVHELVAKPKMKPRVAATVAPAPRAQALPVQLKEALPVANEQSSAVEETYEQVTTSLRALMFGPDQSPTNFEARSSAIEPSPLCPEPSRSTPWSAVTAAE